MRTTPEARGYKSGPDHLMMSLRLPKSLFYRIKALAVKNNRSMNKQVIQLMKQKP